MDNKNKKDNLKKVWFISFLLFFLLNMIIFYTISFFDLYNKLYNKNTTEDTENTETIEASEVKDITNVYVLDTESNIVSTYKNVNSVHINSNGSVTMRIDGAIPKIITLVNVPVKIEENKNSYLKQEDHVEDKQKLYENQKN